MHMRTIYVCMLLIFIRTGVVSGQNIQYAKEELHKISSVYTGKKGISFMAVSHFYESGSVEPSSNASYSFMAKRGSYYMRFHNFERISNKKFSLVVDHGDKRIVIGKPDADMLGQVVNYNKLQQNTLNLCSRIEVIADSSQQKGFVFYFKNQQYASIKLIYNSVTMAIEQLAVNYVNGSRMEIFYTDYRFSVEDEATFSGNTFMTRVKTKKKKQLPFALTPKYANYQIVNHYN